MCLVEHAHSQEPDGTKLCLEVSGSRSLRGEMSSLAHELTPRWHAQRCLALLERGVCIVTIFNFRLRPIEHVTPWDSSDGPSLGWFGLSDGWYWLSLEGQEVLRGRDAPGGGEPPYVDYQVARLWEDVLDLLPSALEPAPADVAAFLHDVEAWARVVLRTRTERARLDVRSAADADRRDFGWWNARKLDSGYLVKAPSVHVWRTGNEVRIFWASNPDEHELWSPVRGISAMSVRAFLDEVQAFDRAFLAAMEERVRTVVAAGGIEGVSVNLAHLLREQQERSSWLQSVLRRVDQGEQLATDWAPVREFLAKSGLG
jgi:Family of unknown function (DUF5984)